MNEVERYVVDTFKEENKNNDEYIYLSDEEILKINPVTSQDYIAYCNVIIENLNKKINSCLESIEYMQSNIPKDYMLKRENDENLIEEKRELNYLKEQIKKYSEMRNKHLEQIKNEHTK